MSQQEEDLNLRLSNIEASIAALQADQEQPAKASTSTVTDPRVDVLVKELKPYGIHSSLYVEPASVETETVSDGTDAAPTPNSGEEGTPEAPQQ